MFTLPIEVSAAPETVTFALEYSAPDTCPNRSEFLQALRSRSERAREVSPADSPDVAVAIELTQPGDRANGIVERLESPREAQSAQSPAAAERSAAERESPESETSERNVLERNAPREARFEPSSPAERGATSASASLPIRLGAVVLGTIRNQVAPDWTLGGELGVDSAPLNGYALRAGGGLG